MQNNITSCSMQNSQGLSQKKFLNVLKEIFYFCELYLILSHTDLSFLLTIRIKGKS